MADFKYKKTHEFDDSHRHYDSVQPCMVRASLCCAKPNFAPHTAEDAACVQVCAGLSARRGQPASDTAILIVCRGQRMLF